MTRPTGDEILRCINDALAEIHGPRVPFPKHYDTAWAAVFDILADWHTPRGTATWLNRRNGNLGGIRPRDLINEGRAQVVIDEAVRVARG